MVPISAGAADGASAPARAAPPLMRQANPAPGHYVTEGGWGHLDVKPAAGGVAFSIETVGANLHTCSLEGTIRNGVAEVKGDAADPACRVRFKPSPRAVDVESDDATDEACHGFCGARASFPGTYLVEPPECSAAARKRVDADFQRLYKAGSYDAARAQLAPMLSACGRLLDRWSDSRLRNDLAVTLFHLHRAEECRGVLAGLLADYPHTEAELREGLPPGDFDTMLPELRATWHNAKLCGAKL